MDNKVTNGASNEQNSCENISHMVQKNTADDQKQQGCTKRKFELAKEEFHWRVSTKITYTV